MTTAVRLGIVGLLGDIRRSQICLTGLAVSGYEKANSGLSVSVWEMDALLAAYSQACAVLNANAERKVRRAEMAMAMGKEA